MALIVCPNTAINHIKCDESTLGGIKYIFQILKYIIKKFYFYSLMTKFKYDY